MAGGVRHNTNNQSPSKRRLQPRHKKKPASTKADQVPLDLSPKMHKVPSLPTAPLERCIAQILLRRFAIDVARLYSTHLVRLSQNVLPALMLDIILLTGPGWVAANAAKEDMKAYFRGPIAMDLRQAGERVATKSVLWSYTAIRDFAMSHDVEICTKSGVHSQRLMPYLPQLEAHLASLDSQPAPSFARPTALGSLLPKFDLLDKHCLGRVKRMLAAQNQPTPGAKYDSYIESITRTKPNAGDEAKLPPAWRDWRLKLKYGHQVMVETLWEVANEFNPSGYGLVLKDKLENKWCDCGCSTDHLGEVCEPAIREDEEESGHKSRSGKKREWDGRGAGIDEWNTEEEEDVWEQTLDFGYDEKGKFAHVKSAKDFVELRFVNAEREKELGNRAFKEGRHEDAVEHYTKAHNIEPELAHYQLNLAAAYLKLLNWAEAEAACTKSLSLHRSEKGFWRRAKARQMLGKKAEAIDDLKEILKLQPYNEEAHSELQNLLPPKPRPSTPSDKGAGSGSGSGSGRGAMSSMGGKSNTMRPPFDFQDIDLTKLKLVATKRTFQHPEKSYKESFIYPAWDAYDIQTA